MGGEAEESEFAKVCQIGNVRIFSLTPWTKNNEVEAKPVQIFKMWQVRKYEKTEREKTKRKKKGERKGGKRKSKT